MVRDPFDPVQRIDREVADRARRLALGLTLEDDLRTVTGGLIVTEGKGRFLRIIRAVTGSRTLSTTTSRLLRRLVENQANNVFDLRAVQSDLATAQVGLAEELLGHAGKYVDRILFVATADPGLHLQEDEANRYYMPIGDPELLVEATGISVIDAFPVRDISAGGSGQGLQAFPAWLLFADRSPRTACRNRLLFLFGEQTKVYFLPASDGLDAQQPDIKMVRGPGLGALRDVIQDDSSRFVDMELQPLERTDRDDDQLSRLVREGASEALQEALDAGDMTITDCVQSLAAAVTNGISDQIIDLVGDGGGPPEIVVDSPPELLATIMHYLRQRWSQAEFFCNCFDDESTGNLNAILSATLGMMTVDQLPASIPDITGARTKRILGRFTPGTPSNWRQLLREMADYQPSAMRLRDAI